jgi:hypothetical protein
MVAMVATLLAMAMVGGAADAPVTPEEGLALAVVFDTSGSMSEVVKDSGGVMAPKHVIARRALNAILDRLVDYQARTSAGVPHKIHAGLVVFDNGRARIAVPFGPFNSEAMRDWLKQFSGPSGNTPLGQAVQVASQELLKTKLSHKHVLVITDGINTVGEKPEQVIPRIKRQAERQNTGLSLHFVAFDVDARLFDPLKKMGVTVVGAADAKQLNDQLEFIVEKKILLEDEEPKKK